MKLRVECAERLKARELIVELNGDDCGRARYLSVRLLVGGLSFLSLLLVQQIIVVVCGGGSIGSQRGCIIFWFIVGVGLCDLIRL